MQEKFMPELASEERVKYLKSQSLEVKTSSHYRPLTEEELQVAKNSFIDNAHQISKLKDEAKDVMAGYKDKITTLEEENAVYMQSVQTKSAEIEEKIYGIDDQQSGFIHYYNEQGDLINSRRLKPEEKQLRISDRGDEYDNVVNM